MAVRLSAVKVLYALHSGARMLLRRLDDIKYQAEKFGVVRDVYLPKVWRKALMSCV